MRLYLELLTHSFYLIIFAAQTTLLSTLYLNLDFKTSVKQMAITQRYLIEDICYVLDIMFSSFTSLEGKQHVTWLLILHFY